MNEYKITIQKNGQGNGGLLTTPTAPPVAFEYANLDAGQKVIYDNFVAMIGTL